MTEYPKKKWLEDAILDYVSKHGGVDSVDIVSHFKLRCDITLMSLKELINKNKIIETQQFMKRAYYAKHPF